jgi:uncharacterized protein YlxW (UPF0749 family)
MLCKVAATISYQAGDGMKISGKRVILFVVFLIFGIVLSVQYKNAIAVKKASASGKYTLDMLKEQLTTVTMETEELKRAIDENLAMKNELIMEYVTQQNDNKLEKEWESLKLLTGIVGVKGPGVTIRLDDAPAREPDMPLELLIIHDHDIKVILNELKVAGAQAIAVNGERIVPMSEQVCAGPTILINGNRHPVPYVIEAIGNPDELYESMVNSSRIANMIEFNIRVEIMKSKEIVLPKFSSADKLDRYISGLEVVE